MYEESFCARFHASTEFSLHSPVVALLTETQRGGDVCVIGRSPPPPPCEGVRSDRGKAQPPSRRRHRRRRRSPTPLIHPSKAIHAEPTGAVSLFEPADHSKKRRPLLAELCQSRWWPSSSVSAPPFSRPIRAFAGIFLVPSAVEVRLTDRLSGLCMSMCPTSATAATVEEQDELE